MISLQPRLRPLIMLAGCMALVGCLSPDERAEIYGGRFATPEPVAAPEPEPEPAPAPDPAPPATMPGSKYPPPKAAPTVRVSQADLRPIDGLRPAEDMQKPSPAPRPPIPPGITKCNVSKYSHLQGQPLASLNSMQFANPLRIIMPGQAVTQDYSAARLNFDITEQGVIGRIWCG